VFDQVQIRGGDARLPRQIGLTEPQRLPPFADQLSGK